MSSICDIALALGVTLGGLCTPPVEHEPAPLPADDPSAWEIPAPPPKADPPPPPAMPPVVIRKEVRIAPPPAPPAPPPEPEPEPPKPDPMREALTAAWAQGASLPASWGAAAVSRNVGGGAGGGGKSAPAMSTPAMTPADLPTDTEEADYEGDRRTSTRPVDNSRIITADRYITGIVETGINSQVGGEQTGTVIIQTARDVFGYHGRKVLVPKGSRLICDYEPPADMGSTRLALTCRRILLGGHRAEIRQLETPVSDVQGRVGVTGDVDRRFWERYGTAFALTGISTAVRFAAATTKSEDSDGEASVAAAEKAAEEMGTRFGEITASVLEESLSLKQIITIPQGTRIQIRPASDWYIAAVE